MQSEELPATQHENIEHLFKTHEEISDLASKLHGAYKRRHEAMVRIFDEIAQNPSIYSHVALSDGRAKSRTETMTPELLGRLRQKYEATLRPVTISGPGCDDPPACPPIPGCVCVFSVGSLCCYVCLSPKVIRCDF